MKQQVFTQVLLLFPPPVVVVLVPVVDVPNETIVSQT